MTMSDDSAVPPLEDLLSRLKDPEPAMDAAIRAWIEFNELPHTEEIYNRAACALVASLMFLLGEKRPGEQGWAGLKNGEFVRSLRAAMTPVDPMKQFDAPLDAVGMLAMGVRVKNGHVALEYGSGATIGLDTDTARILAGGLLECAAEIDGRKATVFFLGVPPHKHSEGKGRRS